MKLLECKVTFFDGKTCDCHSVEQMLSIVVNEKKNNRIPMSFELSAIDTDGVVYKTRLNFIEFSTQQRVLDKQTLAQIAQQKLLGAILVEEKIITEEQLKEAIEIQNKYKEKLGEILVKFGYCTPEKIIYALAKQIGIELKKEEIIPRKGKNNKGSVG